MKIICTKTINNNQKNYLTEAPVECQKGKKV